MVMWQLTIDANDPARLVRFWAPLLGYEEQPPPEGFDSWVAWYLSVGVPAEEFEGGTDEDYLDRIHDPTGRGPNIWFQIVPETKTQKNRFHLDLYPTRRDRSLTVEQRRDLVEAMVADAVAAGATVDHRTVDDHTYYVVMHDPEGNEFCVS